MLLKITEQWGPALTQLGLVLLGGLVVLGTLIWGLSNLFRGKAKKKSWVAFSVFVAIVVFVALIAFIVLA